MGNYYRSTGGQRSARLSQGVEGGLREDPWNKKLQELIRNFIDKKGQGLEEIYFFGSRLWGGAGYASDFDLAVKGEGGVIRRLAEYLEESTFPFEVDIVAWEELPEKLRRKIEREGEKWL